MRKIFALIVAVLVGFSASAADIFIRGEMNGWAAQPAWKFTTSDNVIYHIDNVSITANQSWKIASEDWSTVDYGCATPIVPGEIVQMTERGGNCKLSAAYTGPVYFNLNLGKIVFGDEPASWEETPDNPDNPDINEGTGVYLRGDMIPGWAAVSEWEFSATDNTDIIKLDNVTIAAANSWKVASQDWQTVNWGGMTDVKPGIITQLVRNNDNNCNLAEDYSGPVYFNLKLGKIVFGQEPASWEGTPDIHEGTGVYLRGDMIPGWAAVSEWEFAATDTPDIVKLTDVTIAATNLWKVASEDWTTINWGGATDVKPGVRTNLISGDNNNCTLAEDFTGDVTFNLATGEILFGEEGEVVVTGLSGTLPVLYINIYNTDADGNYTTLNNEVLSKDLADKNYRPGEYWLDVTPCAWAEEAGFKNVGSKEEPLPLEMKARGNYTRTGFAKKPFKLKLGKKQSLLGMTPAKSKHWAILAHADDGFGYLRNFVGFNLGDRIELPWTPDQQPVEVVINGDYRGLYFLTESIRVGDGRVPAEELDDNSTDPMTASGGYLIELDNYDEENQIQMTEGSCAPGYFTDMLRVTWDTPEEYSDIQRKFVTEQFTAMNNAVASCNRSNDLWAYMDLDDAARYYIVEEIVSHTESYHGSTYLFRDRGENQKWHFSPLWDFGNAFSGATDRYFFDDTLFGNTWIPSMVRNEKFMDKVRQTWKWFMANKYDGLIADIDLYVSRISEAAKADRKRWANAPLPSTANATAVVDNTDMQSRRNSAVDRLNRKIEWLKGQWGSFDGNYEEPAHDTTPAAELPSYVNPPSPEHVTNIFFTDASAQPWTEVYAYIYDSASRSVYEPLGSWPGSKLFEEKYGSGKAHAIHFYSEIPLSENARIMFNNGSDSTVASEVLHNNLYTRNDDQLTTGIENVAVDFEGPAEYYDLRGVRLSAPLNHGVTIIRRGSVVTKEIR